LISPEAQDEIKALAEANPDKSVMLIAERGTMGVGSSRMSGVNNVALWTGKKSKSLCSIYQYCSNYCWYKWYFAYFPNNSRSYRWN
jgi:aconitase B